MKRRHYLVPALIFSGLVLASCATTQLELKEVDRAEAAVEAVVSDASVRKYAQAELREAEALLEQTRERQKAGADRPELLHLAQLTETQADIARERARFKALESRVEELSSQREVLRAEARAKRAEQAAAQADARRQEEEARRARAEQQAAEEAYQREMAQQQALADREERMAAELRLREMELEAERMREEAERLQQQIAELEARPTDRGLVLTLGSDVLFDFDKYDLREGAMRTMDRIAEFLNEYEDRKLLIEGFTDSTGTRDYNMQLSEQRADSVRKALVERGVSESRISTTGYGPDYPVADNSTESGRQLNRRVEVIISDDEEDVPDRTADDQ
ncbi:MAG TPA: OmpA family protein [Wenzhouxiangella sp.]|nr:OmpA family protein [Wenzhouxiangella sp.]